MSKKIDYDDLLRMLNNRELEASRRRSVGIKNEMKLISLQEGAKVSEIKAIKAELIKKYGAPG